MKKLPKARTSDLIVQKSENETLIYDLKLNEAHCLNEMSSLVFELCDGERRPVHIAERTGEYFGKPVSTELVWLAIDQLEKVGLVKNIDGLNSFLGGSSSSRREAIRRIGFASLIGLPIVSSIIAPRAIAAQSALGLNEVCTADPVCASGNCVASGFNPLGMVCCVPSAVSNNSPGAQLAITPASVPNETCATTCTNAAQPGGSHANSCCSGIFNLTQSGPFSPGFCSCIGNCG